MLTKKAAVRGRGERGQAIILFVLVVTVIFLMAAITIDFGIWLSERRGAQTDADAASLAGAQELLAQNFVDPAANALLKPTIQAAAEDAAYEWAGRNEVPPGDVHDLQVYEGNCFGNSSFLDTVELSAEHHSVALFSSIFGLNAPQIGAPATACLGSIISAEGLLPVAVQVAGFESNCWEDVNGDGIEDPKFGEQCNLTFAGQDLTSGEGGSLSLENDGEFTCSEQGGGTNTFWDEIEAGGADTTCYVMPYGETCDTMPQACVYAQEGTRPGVAWEDHLGTLLESEGECDALPGIGDGDTIDEWLEALEPVNGDPTPSPDTAFVERDCESPRLVSLIIIDQFDPQGNERRPILAFAGFFIEGCVRDAEFDAKCDLSGAQGQIGVRGRFVNILVTNGAVGGISAWSPKKIALAE